MFKKILLGLAVIIAVILLTAVFRPKTYHVHRTVSIQAAPEKVMALIDDFHNWPKWSPWQQLDPNMTVTYSGAPSGEGAVYAWQGNRKVGSGSMRIVSEDSPNIVDMELKFIKPMEDTAPTAFNLVHTADSTTVTWAMSGNMPYISRVMCMFVSMDKMIGGDFERGLQNLKRVAEQK